MKIFFSLKEIVLQWCYWTFHIQHSFFLTLETYSANRHEMTHIGLGCHNTKLIIFFNISLKKYSHHFLSSLNQFKILLLCKVKTCQFVMKDTNISVEVFLRKVLRYACLMTKCDSSEEFNYFLLFVSDWTIENLINFFINKLSSEFKLIW